jgi:nucleoside-diphosphate-sugar epimerase
MEAILGFLNKMEHALIAGGTGFIGQKLARDLLSHGFKVTVLSRSDSVHNDKFETISCDVADIAELRKKVKNKKFDIVINCIGYVDHSSFGSSLEQDIFNQHFMALKNLTQVCKNFDLKRFIQIGSSAEYGNVKSPVSEDIREQPQSPYAVYKLLATNLLQAMAREHSFPAVIIRVFQIYGENQPTNRVIPSAIQGLRRDEEFECTDGDQMRDFLHIDDLCRLLIRIIDKKNLEPGLILNAGSGMPVSIKDLLKLLKDKINSGTLKFGSKPRLSWETQNLYPDMQRTQEKLGWKSEISLDKGIERITLDIAHD